MEMRRIEDYLQHRKLYVQGELGGGLYTISDTVRAFYRGQEDLLAEMLTLVYLIRKEEEKCR